MQWWEILVGILLFIVALGVLIGIHELGHLGAAKLFHVYCFNYSIGFGPKLISSKRSKKHETIWSLRAIPLGGFVAMYGEGMPNDTTEFIPPSRSIEGIARYKRAIIISAGVFLNFILGFVLILIHNGCFDHAYFKFDNVNVNTPYITSKVDCSFNDTLKSQGLNDGDQMELFLDPLQGVFLIEQDFSISGIAQKYILCMSNVVTSTKSDPPISNSLVIYEQEKTDIAIEDSIKKGFDNNRLANFMISNGDKRPIEQIINEDIKGLSNDARNQKYREVVQKYYQLHGGFSYTANLNTQYKIDSSTPQLQANFYFYHNEQRTKHTLPLENNGSGFKDIGVYMKRYFKRYNAAETFKYSWDEWCGANTAVFRGLGMLLTGQGNVSGPIGIAKISTDILSNFGFERYLYLWGMISCNLAILNLLPFPGLDGWSLVVIGYEAVRKKQIPTKVKSIISFVGLALLFTLMIFIIIKDIIGLF